MLEKIKDFQITIFAVILAIGFIVSAKSATENLVKDGISVTGSANQEVVSDSANVRIELNAKNATKAGAYNQIKVQTPIILEFIKSKGFVDADIDVMSTNSY